RGLVVCFAGGGGTYRGRPPPRPVGGVCPWLFPAGSGAVCPATRRAAPPTRTAMASRPPSWTGAGGTLENSAVFARRKRHLPALAPSPQADSPCDDDGCDRVMDVDVLRDAKVAVPGLATTTGTPPLIVEAAVYYVTGGLITGGPFSYWATVDVPRHQVPQQCWPNLYHAPPWQQTADRLVEAIGDRPVVLHDSDQWEVLRRNLPDWQPAELVLTRSLAEQTWPDLTDYSLGPLTTTARLPTPSGHGAVVQAQVTT